MQLVNEDLVVCFGEVILFFNGVLVNDLLIKD